MLLVVAYDVDTENKDGQKRLRKVAKYCEKYGQRVQSSVFECLLDASQLVRFKTDINKLIDKNQDSVRIYNLGNKYKNHIEVMGIEKVKHKQDDLLII